MQPLWQEKASRRLPSFEQVWRSGVVQALRKGLPSFRDDMGPFAGLTQNHRGERARSSEALQQTCCARRNRKVRARVRELPCGTLGAETGRSSAWSERRVWDAEVAGSDPAAPTRTDRLTVVRFRHARLRPVRARESRSREVLPRLGRLRPGRPNCPPFEPIGCPLKLGTNEHVRLRVGDLLDQRRRIRLF